MTLRTVIPTDELGEQVLARLRSEDLALLPHRVRVREVEDALGEDAWHLDLLLGPPQGDTWDWEQVTLLLGRAAEVFDEIAEDRGLLLPGRTIAAPVEDTTAPGEDVGAPGPWDRLDPVPRR